ncbi:MAG: hypothetical protein KDK70_12340 [Myxococcales bacterium]|nr:hypothetical protein [Myxococcales bacterium]
MRRLWLVLASTLVACGDSGSGRTSADDGVASVTAGTTPGTGSTTQSNTQGTDSASATGPDLDTGTTSAIKFDLGVDPTGTTGGDMTQPVRMLPGLVSITFYERTGGTEPDAFTFAVDGSELTVRLADPLADGNFDIDGATGEFYDVYYSDQDGVFDIDGRYLTISGVFGQPLPAGGGLNLAEIGLNFQDATEYGNYVASFVILGDNAVQPDGNADNAIDGDLQTHTTMGNTVGSQERLRVTLGFLSSSGPPPG